MKLLHSKAQRKAFWTSLVALFCTIAVFAVTYFSVVEHFTYRAATNRYVFTDTSSIKKTVLIPANGTADVSLQNLNAGANDQNYLFALILSPTDAADVQYLSALSGTRYSYGIAGYSREPVGAVVYEGIDVRTDATVTLRNNSIADVNVNVYAVRDSGQNAYVGSFFDLQMSAQELLHNFGDENIAEDGVIAAKTPIDDDIYPFSHSGDYADVYFVSSFTVPESYTYNVPSYWHLLDAVVTLQAPLTIAHGYGGLFSIATLSGSIDNSTQIFRINTPYAYYKTENVSGFTATDVVTTAANFQKISEGLDLTDAANATIKAAVLSDADLYLEKYLKHTMFEGADVYYLAQSVVLPNHYYNYGISYVYTSLNTAFAESGVVTRASSDVTGNFSGAVFFRDDAAATATQTLATCVVGTDASTVREAYMDALGVYLTKNQPAGESLTLQNDLFYQGIDIRFFTERFAEQTLVSGASALHNATLYFAENQLFCEVPNSAGSEDLNAVTFTYEGNKIGVSALSGVSAVIVKHIYHISTGTETVKLSFAGADAVNRFDVSYVGSSIEARNDFLEQHAPQIYIGAAATNFSIINTQENGVFVGSTHTGARVSPTNLSIDSQTNSIYYMNADALSALSLIQDSQTLSRVQKSAAIEALLQNNTTEPTLAAILTDNALGTPLCSTSYAGNPLLGTTAQNAYFTLTEDGVLRMNAASFEVFGGVLVLCSKVAYDDGEANYLYHLTRTFYSPASGLGGSDLGYTESGIFSDVFSSDRNWCAVGTETLRVDDPARWIESITYTITTPSGGTVTSCDYFSIVSNGDGTFRLSVTKENIPTENSTIHVTAVITDGSTAITENYSFIIHGIYLYAEDIDDIWIYLRMCQTYGEWSGYLRADDLARTKDHFDCAFSTLNTSENAASDGHAVNINYLVACGIISSVPTLPQLSDVRSLEGIQYLKNTAEMTFDHIKVQSLAPFAAFQSNTLTKLSLSDCAVTTAKLRQSDSVPYPLYALNKLQTLLLSENDGITALSKTAANDSLYLFYRTVLTLDLDGCNLNSLNGIQSLVQLETLKCRNNAIQNFEHLCEVPTLTTVYLGSNPSDASGYYGTHGKINLCNIVNLVHRGIAVYTQSGTTDNLVRIYEKSGSNYYLKGKYTPTNTITPALESTANILQSGGYLVNLEQEFLGVAVRSFFNYASYNADVADTTNYAQAIPVMFPATMSEYSSSGTDYYSVTAVDLNPASTANTRTYRISIKYSTGSADAYRFAGNYTAQEVANGDFMEVYREITFDVHLV